MSRYGRHRDKRFRFLKRGIIAAVIGIAGWQVLGFVTRVNRTAAAAKEHVAPKVSDDSRVAVERDLDDGGNFGIKPLDPPAPRGPATVEELIARGHKADALLEKAEQAREGHRPLEQRAALNQALALLDEGPHATAVRETLAAMNTDIFLGKSILPNDPYAITVPIQTNDSFQKIARGFHISSDLVALLNPDVNPRRLRVGAGIKVVQGPFNLRVVRDGGRMDLYARDLYVRSYETHFEDGVYLPAGLYKVRVGGKVNTKNAAGVLLERLELTGAEAQTQQVKVVTIYANPTMRVPAGGGMVAGMQVSEGDMTQLWAALIEDGSWVKVEE